MLKCERQRGRRTEKTEADRGDHRVVQVFIRPEVFSIHMKGLKIPDLGASIPSQCTLSRHCFLRPNSESKQGTCVPS
jgi:hypothetical protein